ncbi:hypothetical protein ABZ570_32865 [Micromonospora sp. NPDC007271]|uniref:hypothetical protein n=1 Tax=Micromonospora sp. NPDC007271 TaxID=3154587 RepID=UPI0033E5E075
MSGDDEGASVDRVGEAFACAVEGWFEGHAGSLTAVVIDEPLRAVGGLLPGTAVTRMIRRLDGDGL